MKIWYNEIKEFYMQKFIQAYIEKLDVTTIIENILTKVISLLLLLIVFYIAKKFILLKKCFIPWCRELPNLL